MYFLASYVTIANGTFVNMSLVSRPFLAVSQNEKRNASALLFEPYKTKFQLRVANIKKLTLLFITTIDKHER